MNRNKKQIILLLLFFLIISIPYVSSQLNKENCSISMDIEILDPSAVAYWNFNENNGSILYDYSGNGNNGTIVNAVWTEGWNKSALEFDGDDYVEFPYSTSFQSLEEGFTIEIFFKMTSYGTQGGCCLLKMARTNVEPIPLFENNFALYANSIPDENNIMICYSQFVWEIYSYQVPLNEWILLHLVAQDVPSSGYPIDLYLYINGTYICSGTSADTIEHDDPANVYLGTGINENAVLTDFFYGIIDEFGIFHTSLSSSVIQERYNYYANLDHSPPEIISTGYFSYSFGELNNFINWTLIDENPKFFKLYKDDILIYTDDWENGSVLKWNVDSLAPGTYNYTILASDTRDYITVNTIIVEVIPSIGEFGDSLRFISIASIIVIVVVVRKRKKLNFLI